MNFTLRANYEDSFGLPVYRVLDVCISEDEYGQMRLGAYLNKDLAEYEWNRDSQVDVKVFFSVDKFRKFLEKLDQSGAIGIFTDFDAKCSEYEIVQEHYLKNHFVEEKICFRKYNRMLRQLKENFLEYFDEIGAHFNIEVVNCYLEQGFRYRDSIESYYKECAPTLVERFDHILEVLKDESYIETIIERTDRHF